MRELLDDIDRWRAAPFPRASNRFTPVVTCSASPWWSRPSRTNARHSSTTSRAGWAVMVAGETKLSRRP